jgi:hypothetical protein
MILIEHRDMFTEELHQADLLLVTGNSFMKHDGRLVMGAGAAKQLRSYISSSLFHYDLEKHFGAALSVLFSNPHLCTYGIMYDCIKENAPLFGVFQTKYHWKDKACLSLIELSTHILSIISAQFMRIAVNFPGIGSGGLHEDDVFPIISQLPNNVYIYKK